MTEQDNKVMDAEAFDYSALPQYKAAFKAGFTKAFEIMEERSCVTCAKYNDNGETGFEARCSELNISFISRNPQAFSCKEWITR
jgi:hypothetical protein